VIAQVRFSPILAIQKPEFIAPFQEAIRSTYPVLRREHAQGLALGPNGVAAAQKQTTWRFGEIDGAWRVSLVPEFVALETTSYTSRSDFIDRLKAVVEALQEHIDPALVQRLGLRYIDRVEGDIVGDIEKLVRKEMLGLMATSLSKSNRVQHAISETLFELPDNQERLMVRWVRIPPQGTIDPDAIEPIDMPSWVLDIDMFSGEERPFSTDAIVTDALRYAKRIYAMFRWAVTDEFLLRYGGEP